MLRIRSHVAYPARPKVEPQTAWRWSADEDRKIEDMHDKLSWSQLGALIGRTGKACAARGRKLGIYKGTAND